MMKWIIGIIVVAALGAAAWWGGLLKLPPPQTANTQTQATSTQQVAKEPDNGLSPATDTSDAAVAQDTAAIDAQMTASAQDSADITNSMNDKPVAQSY